MNDSTIIPEINEIMEDGDYPEDDLISTVVEMRVIVAMMTVWILICCGIIWRCGQRLPRSQKEPEDLIDLSIIDVELQSEVLPNIQSPNVFNPIH